MTEAKNDETINRALHEFMGKCWHEAGRSGSNGLVSCVRCPLKMRQSAWFRGVNGNPNYCDDLNAMTEVEKAVVEKFGTDRLYEWTVNEVNGHSEIYAIWATALQRATACVAVIEEQTK